MTNTSFTLKQLTVVITLASGTFSNGSNQVTLAGLRTEVTIDKDGHPSKNASKIKIFGMLENDMNKLTTVSFKALAVKKNFIQVLAGDAENGMGIAFQGEITGAWASYQGPPNLFFHLEALAGFYGAQLPADAAFQKVSLDSNERAGVLSHPYLMTGFAYTATSSPIHRGIFVARSILGRTLLTPPIAVAPTAPQLQPDLTTRDRVAMQTSPEVCQSCHSMINPLGFTLEHFDAVGRFRKDENGKPIVATGAYRTRNGETVQFDGVRDLAKYLAESSETHAAFVEQLFHGVIKQPIRAYGSQTKESLKEAFVRENFSIRKLMVEIIAASALTPADEKTQTVVGSTQP